MKTTQTKQTKSELQNRPEHPIKNNKTETQTQTSTPPVNSTGNTPAKQPNNSQPSTLNSQLPKRILPYVNTAEREFNRTLSTDTVLDTLRQYMPTVYALAEVVGKWVWVTFTDAPSEKVRAGLSQIGFHWNNVRKCWQHPCGTLKTEGTANDPRTKYGSRFPADFKAA